MKKIIIILAFALVVGLLASTFSVAEDIYSLFGARSKSKPDKWPAARELALNLDFEDGTYGVKEYYADTCKIEQLTANKALKLYNAENHTAGTWSHFNMRADDIDEKYQRLESGEIIFASSKLYISMDVVKTSESVYDGVTLQFKGLSGMPHESCWRIVGGGSIFAQDDTKLAEVKPDTWTNVGIIVDIDARTMDYYIDGEHVHSLKFTYATDVVKYFNVAAPVFATTQSVYIDNVKLFFEER